MMTLMLTNQDQPQHLKWKRLVNNPRKRRIGLTKSVTVVTRNELLLFHKTQGGSLPLEAEKLGHLQGMKTIYMLTVHITLKTITLLTIPWMRIMFQFPYCL